MKKQHIPLLILITTILVAEIGYGAQFISNRQFEHTSASGASIETGSGETLLESQENILPQPVPVSSMTTQCPTTSTTPTTTPTKTQVPLTNLPFDKKVEAFFQNEFNEDITTVKEKLMTEFPDPRQYSAALSELKNILREE